MGWKQWSAVAAVIGGGILLQIPGHEEASMDHEGMGPAEAPAEPAAAEAGFRPVTLDITGMT